MENLMVAYYEDRGFFDELLALYHGEMMDEVRIALAAGVKHFFAELVLQLDLDRLVSCDLRNVFAPQLTEMTSAVHAAGGDVNLYDDGKCMAIVDILAGCGIDVLTTLTPPPVGDVDLAEVKRRIGDRVCLMGYVDLHYVIKMGTPNLIARTVRAAIETAGPNRFCPRHVGQHPRRNSHRKRARLFRRRPQIREAQMNGVERPQGGTLSARLDYSTIRKWQLNLSGMRSV